MSVALAGLGEPFLGSAPAAEKGWPRQNPDKLNFH